MNKSDLVAALADRAGMTKADASRAMDAPRPSFMRG